MNKENPVVATMYIPFVEGFHSFVCLGNPGSGGDLYKSVPLYKQALSDTNNKAFTDLLFWAERQICTHEETHRGGAIWEICDMCGAKWADDEGGKPEFSWPSEILGARKALGVD